MSFNSPDSQKRFPKQFPSLAYARAILAGNKKYEEDLKQIEETRRLREEGEKKKTKASPAVEVTPTIEDSDTNHTDSTSAQQIPPTETTAPIIHKTSPAPTDLPVEENSDEEKPMLGNPTQEKAILEKWTANANVQKEISEAKTIFEKISVIRRKTRFGIDNKAVSTEKFSGRKIQTFNGLTGSLSRQGTLKISNPDTKTKTTKRNYSDTIEPHRITVEKMEHDQQQRNEERIQRQNLTEVEREAARKKYKEDKITSEAMEQIFVSSAKEILGENFEFVVPSKIDDLMNGADLIAIQRNSKTGEVEQVFSVDFTFAHESRFIKRKLYRTLTRVKKASLSFLNYVESYNDKTKKNEYFSTMNIPHIIIPLSKQNLGKIAEEYYRRNNNQDLKKIWRNKILSNIHLQLELQEKIINSSTQNDKKKKEVSSAIKKLQDSLPKINSKDKNQFDEAIDKMNDIINIGDKGKENKSWVYKLQRYERLILSGVIDKITRNRTSK